MTNPLLARRSFVRALGLSALCLGAGTRVALADKPSPGRRKVLIVVFQRGAVDGLSMVPPVGDKHYYELRPSIAVPASEAIKLDGTFGLHPALAALEPHYRSGALAVIHAVGSPDGTRSHFDAQDYVEIGTPGLKHTEDGFLNRLLRTTPEKSASTLRALAFSPNLPRILAGRAPVVSTPSLDQLKVQAPGAPAAVSGDFEQMYAAAVDRALRGTAGEAFDAVRQISEIKPSSFPPRTAQATRLRLSASGCGEISQVIQAEVGVEVVFTDCGGWDTHSNQGAAKGQLANRLGDLGASLGAFATDLGDRLADVCLVTVTEFGRTVRENGTAGTDHGHGSVMLALGGKVRGKKVYARWKGLAPEALFESRDLAVTTDHREVFGEVLRAHLGVKDLAPIFPGFTPGAPLGLFG